MKLKCQLKNLIGRKEHLYSFLIYEMFDMLTEGNKEKVIENIKQSIEQSEREKEYKSFI